MLARTEKLVAVSYSLTVKLNQPLPVSSESISNQIENAAEDQGFAGILQNDLAIKLCPDQPTVVVIFIAFPDSYLEEVSNCIVQASVQLSSKTNIELFQFEIIDFELVNVQDSEEKSIHFVKFAAALKVESFFVKVKEGEIVIVSSSFTTMSIISETSI